MNQQCLDTAKAIRSDLWTIEGLLSDQELTYVLDQIHKQTDWVRIPEQNNLNREQIPWTPNGICDWLWCRLSELDFSRFGLKFDHVMIWRDQTGYKIDNHVDHDGVKAAMQVYLSQDCDNLGTWFGDDVEIKFKQNTGYLMHNQNKPVHGMRQAVPDAYQRLSFYALFDTV